MHSYHTRQECITHKQNKHSTIYFSSLQIIRTRTFVRKKDLVLPRLRLKYSSALSLFLSFLSSLFRSYSQFYFLSLSDK